MIEIIPNWHPVLVHFTVGLLFTAVMFYFAHSFLPERFSWRQQWLHMANWSLWTGSVLTLATVIAGILAFNTVAHDTASHLAMSLHRNWALPTALVFIMLAIMAVRLARKQQNPGWIFLSASGIAGLMLIATAYLGAEVVYRHGIGVLSLPDIEADAGHHQHDHAQHDDEHSDTEPDGHDHQH